jgi:hypothetical protein
MKQIISLEYLRAFAIACIIIDHYIGGTFGRYLGETFICVFFGISATLFGLKWKSDNQPKYNFLPFLYPRILRLSVGFYPFLTTSILVLLYLSIPVTPKKIVLNFMLLPWFGKIPWLGHLWFLTMIIMCYGLYVLISKFNLFLNRSHVLILIFLSLLLQYITQQIGLPGYVFLILMYCGILFVNANVFIDKIKTFKLTLLIPIYILINSLAIYLYSIGLFSFSPTISKWVGTTCGFSNLILFIRYFDDTKIPWAVSFLSVLSYELYLVHNPLIMLKSNLLSLTNSKYISFIIYIIISFICAWLLKHISSFFYKNIKKIESAIVSSLH